MLAKVLRELLSHHFKTGAVNVAMQDLDLPADAGWGAAIKGWPAPPTLNMDLMWVVITGLLGIGGRRSVEKIKGAAK